MTTHTDREDFDFLRANAQAGIAQGLTHFLHLDQPIGLWNYIRIANDIAKRIPRAAHMLDWGCGMGQMSYLMKRRGFSVTSYDVREPADVLPDTPLSQTLERIVSTEPTRLPFDADQFDAVLSCGVLEHVDEYSQVGNESKSVLEIARVLKPGGKFLIYQLPQRDAWQESIIRKLKLGYAHPRRYTESEIRTMLLAARFAQVNVRRANLIPKNLTGVPSSIRRAYSAFAKLLIAADTAVSQLPLVRNLAGVLEIDASAQA
jgi:2-polyprenyl-3-methyl-5-hydroxy-6-metoxy-1,4-benzoquinol methylase